MSSNSKNKLINFAIGEYEYVPLGGERLSVKHLRNDFVQTVTKLIPEISQELESEFLPLYQQIPLFCYEAGNKVQREEELKLLFVDDPVSWQQFRETTDEVKRYAWVKEYQPTWDSLEQNWEKSLVESQHENKSGKKPANSLKLLNRHRQVIADYRSAAMDHGIPEFIKKIVEWSKGINLDEVWFRAHAYKTLDLWCYDELWRREHIWTFEPYEMPFFAHPIPIVKGSPVGEFVFKYSTLYPSKGFRREVKDEIMRAFKKELDKFLDEREQAAKNSSMEITPHKQDEIHFVWLALHRVKKPPMTCEQIFKRHEEQSKKTDLRIIKSVRAIEKAVKKLADELGLAPLYCGRGRRPKPIEK